VFGFAKTSWVVSLIPILSLQALGVSESTPVTPATASAPAIVVGFVGGFVGRNDLRHGPVQLAQRLQREVPQSAAYVRVFENRHRKRAYKTILHLLDCNHDGVLSQTEKEHARIVLYGHSWGAAAAVLLARDLRRRGIPVLLTVQVDSVAKLWQNDSVIPDNVAEAVNYYQPHGIVHGSARIVAADPLKTRILGNYMMDYRKHPVGCAENSWYDRFFTPGHAQSECDPHVWSQIEKMVVELVMPQPSAVAANPSPLPDAALQENIVDKASVADKGSDRH